MRVAHAKASSQGLIEGADWDADHVIEDAEHSHDYAAPGHTHDLTHTHTGFADDEHTHQLEVHSHDTSHGHTAADVGAATADHSHDTTHDHDGDYAPVHAHDFASSGHTHDTSHSHTAAEVGAAGTGHTHDTSHSHDLTAYATDADLTAHAGTPHGGGEGVPSGVIVMWGGLVANIPAGWNLCDGTNGTPDLTDRFVKGGVPGSTGGTSTHTHAAHSSPINHTHTVAVTDPGHVHVQGVNSAATGGLSGYTADTSTNTRVNSGYSTSSGTTGITASTANPAGGVASLTHDTPNHEPPYYTLAFIQKS